MQLVISDDKMEVILTHEKSVNRDSVLELLSDRNIIYGIDFKAIEEYIKSGRNNGKIIVANGLKPGVSKDGYVQWYVDIPSDRIRENKNGTVDFFNLDLFKFVKEGEEIACIHAPVNGQNGINVFGKKIPPVPGKKANLSIRSGFSKSDNKVIAMTDGAIKLNGNMLSLDPVLVVNSDVNFSTGNIESNVNVIINGWVKMGFNVKSEKDVIINGGIEGKNSINAGGSISVKLGITGKNDIKIKCGRNLLAKFVNGAEIEASENILVNEYIMNSNVTCGGSVFLNGKKGALITSTVKAEVSVTIKSFKGNKDTGISVTGFNRNEYVKNMGVWIEEKNRIKEEMKRLTWKIRCERSADKDLLKDLLVEYQKLETRLLDVEMQIKKYRNILTKVEGEGMIKLLSPTDQVNLKIKHEKINLKNSRPVKIFYDPKERGVISECLEKL